MKNKNLILISFLLIFTGCAALDVVDHAIGDNDKQMIPKKVVKIWDAKNSSTGVKETRFKLDEHCDGFWGDYVLSSKDPNYSENLQLVKKAFQYGNKIVFKCAEYPTEIRLIPLNN